MLQLPHLKLKPHDDPTLYSRLLTVVIEHSVLSVWEIYALENVVFCIAVYGVYKPYTVLMRY